MILNPTLTYMLINSLANNHLEISMEKTINM